MAKFRCGVARIHIETDKYANVSSNEQLCILCDKHHVGDEFHVLMIFVIMSDSQMA